MLDLIFLNSVGRYRFALRFFREFGGKVGIFLFKLERKNLGSLFISSCCESRGFVL